MEVKHEIVGIVSCTPSHCLQASQDYALSLQEFMYG